MAASDTQRSAFHRARDVTGLFASTDRKNAMRGSDHTSARDSIENQKRKFSKQPVVSLPPDFDELLRTYEIFPLRKFSADDDAHSSDEEFLDAERDAPPAFAANDFSFPGNTAYDQEWVGKKVLHHLADCRTGPPPPGGSFGARPPPGSTSSHLLLSRSGGGRGAAAGATTDLVTAQHVKMSEPSALYNRGQLLDPAAKANVTTELVAKSLGFRGDREAPGPDKNYEVDYDGDPSLLAGVVGPKEFQAAGRVEQRLGSKLSSTTSSSAVGGSSKYLYSRLHQREQDSHRSRPALRRSSNCINGAASASSSELHGTMPQQSQLPVFSLQGGKVVSSPSPSRTTRKGSSSPSKRKFLIPPGARRPEETETMQRKTPTTSDVDHPPGGQHKNMNSYSTAPPPAASAFSFYLENVGQVDEFGRLLGDGATEQSTGKNGSDGLESAVRDRYDPSRILASQQLEGRSGRGDDVHLLGAVPPSRVKNHVAEDHYMHTPTDTRSSSSRTGASPPGFTKINSSAAAREVLLRLPNGRVTSQSPDMKRYLQRPAPSASATAPKASRSRVPVYHSPGDEDDRDDGEISPLQLVQALAQHKTNYQHSHEHSPLAALDSTTKKRLSNASATSSAAESSTYTSAVLQQAGLHSMASQLGKHHPHHPRNKHQTRKRALQTGQTPAAQRDLDINWHSLPGI
ncbi:unnamed protein product [Amoebophrya sp. A120]|nr:unnamed protein product [Amoebophrya sp. A120]|eukprot:GSA120T00019046001.1